jgi:peptidoglycan/LPS O-acetylase OafA/YrhL
VPAYRTRVTGIDPSEAPPPTGSRGRPVRRILRALALPRAQSAGSYRPDIDGLRAVAVLSVLLYHLHLPFTPGGFVGVDIFFVISGFLITRNIWTEMQAGHFSVKAFYLRRIRRIAPAFLVMAGAVLIVGCLLLLPADLRRLGAATASAAVSASNIFFWRTLDTGYFADSSEQEPLLHTWSLGVEEQFYLLWPATLLLLTVVLKGRRRTVTLTTLGILVASFAIGQATLATSPKFAYFMLPARAGELMTGALLAFALPREPNPAALAQRLGFLPARVAAEIIGIAGFGLIAYSLTQLNGASPFPGLNAVYPSLGSVLVMLAGALGSRLVIGLLGSAPMVFVGLISYSLYLWHWPVLAFLRYFYTDLDAVQVVVAVPVMFALAIASYRFVELPARSWRPPPRVQVSRLFLAPATALVVAAVLIVATDGLVPVIDASPSFRAELATATSQTKPALDFDYNCQQGRLRPDILTEPVCRIGTGGGASSEPGVLLWGDSQAAAAIGILGAVAKREGRQFRNATFSTCPPVFDGEWGTGVYRAGCTAFRALVRQAVEAGRYHVVVMGGEWSSYDRLPGFRDALEATVRTLAAAGVHVVLLGQVPSFEAYQRQCQARALRLPIVDCNALATTADTGEASYNLAVADLADRVQGTSYLSARAWICTDGRCQPFLDGRPLYFDTGHLSMDGSWRLGDLIAASPEEQTWASAIWSASTASP